MYIVFFLLSRPPWKSAIAEGVSVNKYSFNNNNNREPLEHDNNKSGRYISPVIIDGL